MGKPGRPKGSVKSRRIVVAEKISKTGIALTKCYCRKCMQTLDSNDFYDATDFYLDSNGKMSVCKNCINEMYNRIYQSEHSMDRTILRLCRMLNMKYDEGAIASIRESIAKDESEGKKARSIISLYKNRMTVRAKRAPNTQKTESIGDLTFVEPNLNISNLPIDEDEAPIDVKEYYDSFWGEGLTLDDYEYLEQEFAEWQRTTKCDTQSELILVKELCFKENEIRKARLEGKNVDSLVKSMQEIMKNSALTPAQANAANSGKNAETYGLWIKDTENMSPAEWFDKQEKYDDVDGLRSQYIDKYMIRSTKNFMTGSRDFNVDEIIGEEGEDLESEESEV